MKKLFTKRLGLILLTNFIFLLAFCLLAEMILRYKVDFKGNSKKVGTASIFKSSSNNSWEHQENATDFFNGNEIHINNLGLRDDDFYFSEEEKSILLLGDSFVFAGEVKKEDTFSEVLEKKINLNSEEKWKVVNAGHIGHTTDNHYLTLKRLYEKIKPELVILNFFVGNDLTELRRHKWVEKNGEIEKVIDTRIFVDEKNNLRSLHSKIPKFYFLHFLGKRLEILKSKLGFAKQEEVTLTWPAFLKNSDIGYDSRMPIFWEKTEKALKLIKKFSSEKGFDFKVVIIPMDVQVSKFYWKKYPNMFFYEDSFLEKRPQKKLLSFCKKEKLDCLDLLPSFQENYKKEKIYFEKDDPHFQREGHQIAAELIYEFIKNLYKLP